MAGGPGDSGSPESGGGGRRSRRRAGRSDETVRSPALPEAVRCPHCESTETEQFAAFGSSLSVSQYSLSVSQYYCRGCRTVFEFFEWR